MRLVWQALDKTAGRKRESENVPIVSFVKMLDMQMQIQEEQVSREVLLAGLQE